MTVRKPNLASIIKDVEVEMKNREEAMERITKEAEELAEKEKAGKASKADLKRADDLREMAQDHIRWIADNKKTLKEFYRPAMVLAD